MAGCIELNRVKHGIPFYFIFLFYVLFFLINLFVLSGFLNVINVPRMLVDIYDHERRTFMDCR